MAIDLEAVRHALADKFDLRADYVVCGYNEQGRMLARGYKQVGAIQDPTPADQDLLIFDRREVLEREAKALADWREKDKAEREKRDADSRKAAEKAAPPPKTAPLIEKPRKRGMFS